MRKHTQTIAKLSLVAMLIGTCLLMPLVATAETTQPTNTTAPQGEVGVFNPEVSKAVRLSVQFVPEIEEGKVGALLSVDIPSDVQLPVTVRIPIYANADPFWVGEILGGAAQDDPSTAYKLGEADGMPYADIVLSKSRRGQIEMYLDAPVKSESGKEATLAASIKNIWDVALPYQVSVTILEGSTLVSSTPKAGADVKTSEAGDTLYNLAGTVLEAGKSAETKVTYSIGEHTHTQEGTSSPSALVFVVIFLGVVVIAGLLKVNATRNKKSLSE